MGYNNWLDIITLDKVHFNVILGMDRMSSYHVILDCIAKTVTLVMHIGSRVA